MRKVFYGKGMAGKRFELNMMARVLKATRVIYERMHSAAARDESLEVEAERLNRELSDEAEKHFRKTCRASEEKLGLAYDELHAITEKEKQLLEEEANKALKWVNTAKRWTSKK